MKRSRLLFGLLALAALAFGGSGAAVAKPGTTTCGDETLATGVYDGLRVTGHCVVNSMVVVFGDVKIDDGAYLDATYFNTRLTIDGNVKVGRRAKLGLGCTWGYHDCLFGGNWLGAVKVNGNVEARDALTMYLDFAIIQGNVDWHHGGDATMGDEPDPGNPGQTIENGLVHVIKDNVIGGNLKVDGWAGAWFGVIRNTVFGNVSVAHTSGNRNHGFLDSTEVATNIISGNLSCKDNSPPAQIGDSGGDPNIVGGKKSGECAGL
jgi:hypothetical protein